MIWKIAHFLHLKCHKSNANSVHFSLNFHTNFICAGETGRKTSVRNTYLLGTFPIFWRGSQKTNNFEIQTILHNLCTSSFFVHCIWLPSCNFISCCIFMFSVVNTVCRLRHHLIKLNLARHFFTLTVSKNSFDRLMELQRSVTLHLCTLVATAFHRASAEAWLGHSLGIKWCTSNVSMHKQLTFSKVCL